jgi:AraC-like DNA-binding protein
MPFSSAKGAAMAIDPIRDWREQYARCCLRVDFEPLPGTTFDASVKPIFPELGIIRTASSPGFVFRDEGLLRDGNDSFELIVAQSQELNITHQGREIRLGPGDATIMQASATGRVGSRKRFGFLEVLVSSAEWETRGCRAGDAFMQHIGTNSGALKLLHGYIRSLEKSTSLAMSAEGRGIARRHMLDLMAVAVTSRRPIGESGLDAAKAAHTHAIFDHLASHFSDPELSLPKVAQSLQISPRYLQRLLETSGTSFTAHVNELRLKHAFMLLTAQDLSNVRICDIALEVGFSDISHFNRLFRSRFGDTPKGVRANQQTPLTSKVACSEPRVGINPRSYSAPRARVSP